MSAPPATGRATRSSRASPAVILSNAKEPGISIKKQDAGILHCVQNDRRERQRLKPACRLQAAGGTYLATFAMYADVLFQH